ncbi:MAG TPA: VOC family protein [Bryobacteraceae bacterium]|nr:VOC family protein [Bryobacteraceae bacterium]
MLRILVVMLAPVVLSGADLKIDHVTVAGRDLKALRAALASVGIPSEYGGPHANHATEMAVTSFADGSYLELIALQAAPDPKAVAAHDWSVQIQNDAGPCSWAVLVPDVDAERRRLLAAHIAAGAPERSGRARPDGIQLRWETAQVGDERRGTFFPFLIRDITPREQRAFPSGKPTAPDFRGVTRVVIATRDLRASSARFQAAFGWPAPVEQDDPAFGARLAVFKGTPVVLAAPLDARSWIADRLHRFGEGPCAFIFGLQKKTALKTPARTIWAGTEISWLDSRALGWHLGVE